MDMASIECVSYSDSMDDDDDDGVGVGGVSHLPRPILVKPSSAAAAVNVVVVSAGSGGGGGGRRRRRGRGRGRGPRRPPGDERPRAARVPRLHQLHCQNGHTLCSTCKTRVHNRCPTCRQELGDIRCLALEKVAESLELPCKYYSLGCPEIFPYYSKLKHESQCNFRPYNCPYAGSECSVVGDIPFLVAHLRDDHKVDMHSGCTFNHRYVKSNPREVENATWMLTVFHCFGQYFCLHFEAFQLGVAPVYMAFLRFMGDENDARNYSYSLEVGANGRKMIWEGTPRSIRDSHRKVRDSHDGLIIQRNMALFFSGGERKELKLRVTGRIWKEQQNPDSGACIPNLFS
uniref:RING-type E3 ubiquitin transferase n=1 Tax=Oryza barthii TaxID=65489 RepID=A0A0D3F3X0_9ORYZ